MDFLTHTVAEGVIDELVLLNPAQPAESGTDDHCFEMATIARDLRERALESLFNTGLDLRGRYHSEDERRFAL